MVLGRHVKSGTIGPARRARDARDRDAYTPGWKFAEWEMRGAPLRLEVGPKDIEKSQVLLARRDTREKLPTPMEGLTAGIVTLLETIQKNLYARALKFREEHTARVSTFDEFKR